MSDIRRRTFFHATYKKNLLSIERQGLLVSYCGVHGFDTKRGVFLGTVNEAHRWGLCLTAYKPWLTVDDIVILTLKIPESIAKEFTSDSYHYGTISLKDLPSKYIVAAENPKMAKATDAQRRTEELKEK